MRAREISEFQYSPPTEPIVPPPSFGIRSMPKRAVSRIARASCCICPEIGNAGNTRSIGLAVLGTAFLSILPERERGEIGAR